MSKTCLECDSFIPDIVYNYSVNNFGIPLCRVHQSWIKELPKETTDDALRLYFSLKLRGVPAELEKYDGFKKIDIAVPQAKVNIEVDGRHHNSDHNQALADLRRTYYSFKKGYFTLRIPNSLIKSNLEETADLITEILAISRDKRSSNNYSFKRFNIF